MVHLKGQISFKKKKRKSVTVSVNSISKFSQHVKEVTYVIKKELFYRLVSNVLLTLKKELPFKCKLGDTETLPSACLTSHSGRNQKPSRS